MSDDWISEAARRRLEATNARSANRGETAHGQPSGWLPMAAGRAQAALDWVRDKERSAHDWLDAHPGAREAIDMAGAGAMMGAGGLRSGPAPYGEAEIAAKESQASKLFARGERYENLRSAHHVAVQGRPDQTSVVTPPHRRVVDPLWEKPYRAPSNVRSWATDPLPPRGDPSPQPPSVVPEQSPFGAGRKGIARAEIPRDLHSDMDRGNHWDIEQTRLAAQRRQAYRQGARLASQADAMRAANTASDPPIPWAPIAVIGAKTAYDVGPAFADWLAHYGYEDKTK